MSYLSYLYVQEHDHWSAQSKIILRLSSFLRRWLLFYYHIGPTHGYVGRFLGFSVYISNTTEKKDGVLCFKDNKLTKYTIPAVLTINCTHYGRYVIYYNNRTSSNKPADYSKYAYNELCEFEVYGELFLTNHKYAILKHIKQFA